MKTESSQRGFDKDIPLPEKILDAMGWRLRAALQLMGVSTCWALLRLEQHYILNLPRVGRSTWLALKRIKPRVRSYLSSLQDYPQPQPEAQPGDTAPADSCAALAPSPDTPVDPDLPPQILNSLSNRTRHILYFAGITTCRSFLALREFDVRGLKNAGQKTWLDIKTALPEVEKYLTQFPAASDHETAITTRATNINAYRQWPDKPLPAYFQHRLSLRAQHLLKKAKIKTCHALLAMTREMATGYRNAGRTTWLEIEKFQTLIGSYLRETAAGQEAVDNGIIDYTRFAAYEDFVAAFLRAFRPVTKGEIVCEHRLGILGTGEIITLHATGLLFNPSITREYVRLIEQKILKRYFAPENRVLVATFLDAARAVLAASGGAMLIEPFVAQLAERAGWRAPEHPLCVVNFLCCFGEVSRHDPWRVVFSRDLATGKLPALLRAFCNERKRRPIDINYENFLAYLTRDDSFSGGQVSWQTYRILASQLLNRHVLSEEKTRRLKISITER